MRFRIVLLVVFAGFLFSCESEEDKIIEKAQALIDGESFTPSKNSIVAGESNLVIDLNEEYRYLRIVTNNIIPGSYVVSSDELKSASLRASISFYDGMETYYGKSGVVIIEETEGLYSGNYNAMAESDDNTEIEISSGSFSGIESTKSLLILTEAAINDSLFSSYSKLVKYVELEFIFDAVYSNQVAAPNSSWSDIYGHAQNASNEKVSMLWYDGLSLLYQTNLIILSAYEIVTDESLRNQIVAQAKAIRSYTRIKLMKWFGDIPIISEIEGESLQRYAPEYVLEYILSDLYEAEYLLSKSLPLSEKNIIPEAFIQGIISKASLIKGNYGEAYHYTQQLINSGNYTLSINTDDFTKENTEIILGFSKGKGEEFNAFFNKGEYVPLMRYTEILLSHAEASLIFGFHEEAKNIINLLKSRRGDSEVQNAKFETIFQQYKTELESEGEIFLIMKRFEKAVDELQIPESLLLLPIPQSVLENEANISQNPGY